MMRTCLTVILWGALLVLLTQNQFTHGLRRHERHRRDPSARAEVFSSPSDRELKDEQKENKHRPKFERCDDYEPVVEEESAAGKIFFSHKIKTDSDKF